MTELDQALEKYIQDENQQAQYYDLVLNTDFYIPIENDDSDIPLAERENATPLVIESDNKAYVMLFDNEQRLNEWAKKPIEYIILAGFKLAELSPAGLHWAINAGGKFAKEFVPDEIHWLKESVLQVTDPDQ